MNLKTTPVPASVRTVVDHATGLSTADVQIALRSPLEHQSNRLYDVWADGQHLIAKEFLLPDELHDAPMREYRALCRLAPLDIAPQPVFFDPDLGPIVVYAFMVGEMWDRRIPTAVELAQLAHLWLMMHTLDGDLWPSRGQERSMYDFAAASQVRLDRYSAWVESEFPAGRQALALCTELLAVRRWAIDELMAEPAPLCFCASDVRFANVIQRPGGRLGLVDWEDSGLRDPAHDLAVLLTHPNQEDLLSLNQWQAFLQPYLAGRASQDPQLMQRTRLILAVTPIFWLTLLLSTGLQRVQQGQINGWVVNGLPPNVRLRRYLARALAWPNEIFDNELAALTDITFFPTS